MIKLKITNYIKCIFEMLCQPNKWFDLPHKKKIKFCISFLTYISVGVILQLFFSFPNFYIFISIFLLIGAIVIYSLYYYSIKMKKICNYINEQPFASGANGMYYAFFQKNILYIIFPLIVLFIFEIGGCTMSSASNYNLCMIWVLGLFSFVVYISIVGYLQYFSLFAYIMKLAYSNKPYKNIQHSPNECIPAELEWLQILTKLFHFYRSAFFSLGSLYITAFYLFCFSPEMKTNIKSSFFLILWIIIFIAIVLVFPCTTILQHYWIKEIVRKIKKQYIEDLKFEIKIENQRNSSMFVMQKKLFEIIYVTQIFNSKDYPVSSIFNTGYNFCISIFNFVATIVTILQGLAILPIDFHQII